MNFENLTACEALGLLAWLSKSTEQHIISRMAIEKKSTKPKTK